MNNLYNELPEDEKAFADALIGIAERFGPLDREDSNIWVGYVNAEANENVSIGVKCGNCALAESEVKCRIISQEIEDGGACRLSVVPPGYVTTNKWLGSFLPIA